MRVQGAREVSLFRPVQLPLPLVGALGEGLSDLASRLRLTSQIGDKPLISLRIVGPSSLVAAAMEEADEGSTAARLKVKRLAPGAVELVSRQPAAATADPSVVPDSSSLSLRDSRMWPFSSINSSSSKLVALEEALVQVLGQKAHERGSLKLLEAKAMAASFVQFDFELERSLANASSVPEQWPDWMTAPSVQRFEFQALAKVEGHRLVPVRVDQVEPVRSAVSFLPSVMTGNGSFTELSTFLPPPGAMTLDFDWD